MLEWAMGEMERRRDALRRAQERAQLHEQAAAQASTSGRLVVANLQAEVRRLEAENAGWRRQQESYQACDSARQMTLSEVARVLIAMMELATEAKVSLDNLRTD